VRYNRTFEMPESDQLWKREGHDFERTLIFPHGPLRKFLVSAKLADAAKEIPNCMLL